MNFPLCKKCNLPILPPNTGSSELSCNCEYRFKFFETEDLVDELLKRFDSAVFMGVRHNYEGKDNDTYSIRYNGAISTVRGLIEIARDYTIDATEELMDDDPL